MNVNYKRSLSCKSRFAQKTTKLIINCSPINLFTQFSFGKYKVFLLTILFLCNLFSNNWQASAYDFVTGGIYYNITSPTQNIVEVTYGPQYSNSDITCAYIGDIEIPETVTYKGKSYTVTGIGYRAFYTSSYNSSQTKNLKSINLSNKITYIGDEAFYNCRAIKTITLPQSVKSLGNYVFCNNDNLKTVFISSITPPEVNRYISFGKNCEIIVPDALYWFVSPWKSYDVVEMVKFTKKQFVYNGKRQEIPWESNLPSYDITLEGNITGVNAGSGDADILLKCSENGKLISECKFQRHYIIQKAPLEINITNTSREYGDNNPEFIYTLTGFIDGESESFLKNMPQLSTTATIESSPGEYPITAMLNDDNYSLKSSKGILTIVKAPVLVTPDKICKIYGDPIPLLSLSYQGLKCNETMPLLTHNFTTRTTATQESPVGKYEIIVAGGDSPNYNFSYAPGVLEIEKANLIVEALNTSKIYGVDNPEFDYSLRDAKFTDESPLTAYPLFLCSAEKDSSVGDYAITPYGAESSNYNLTYESGRLMVTKRALLVVADDCVKTYGENNPEFTLNFDGFIEGEDVSVLRRMPIAFCSATEKSNAGHYSIIPQDGDAENYYFNYVNGTLTIEKANQQITWDQTFDDCIEGDQIELLCNSTSGLRIDFIISDESVASLYRIGDTAYLDCLKEGEVTVRAIQEGNINYYPAVRVSKSITIRKAAGINSVVNDENHYDNSFDIYNMQGMCLKRNASKEDVNNLSPGLYIINGKKVIVK